MIDVKIKMLSGYAVVPSQAKPGDACYDLFSVEDIIVPPGETRLIPCGFSIEIPYGWEAQIRPRSGLAFKYGITVLNTPGTIDSGYRGEMKVILHNAGKDKFLINIGDRVAQMCIKPVYEVNFIEVESLSQSERGVGGCGSTGR